MDAPDVHDADGPEQAGTLPPSLQRPAFEPVLLAGGVALFLVLLYTMAFPVQDGGLLNPPLVAGTGILLLWPLRRHKAARALFSAGGFLLVVWFFDRLSGMLLPFMAVYLLAYLFNPLATALHERFRVPRWASSVLVTTLVSGVIALFFLLLVPSLVGELRTFGNRLLDNLTGLRQWLATTSVLDQLEATGLIDKQEVNQGLTDFAQEQAERLARGIPDALQGLVQSIGSLLGLITTLAILPVLVFYMLKDYPLIQQRLFELFPTFGGRRDYLMNAGGIVGNYLRGQLTISAIAAFNVSVLLLLFDVPFALLIGLLGGLFNMIPNIGIVITNVVGVLIAVVFGDPWYVDALIVVLVLMGESLLEQSVLTPNILGRQVGLHPVLILFSLFAFGSLMGIVGLLIAVPVTAILTTFYKAYRAELTLDFSDFRDPLEKTRTRRTKRRRPAPSETSTPEQTPTEDTPSPPAAPDP